THRHRCPVSTTREESFPRSLLHSTQLRPPRTGERTLNAGGTRGPERNTGRCRDCRFAHDGSGRFIYGRTGACDLVEGWRCLSLKSTSAGRHLQSSAVRTVFGDKRRLRKLRLTLLRWLTR